MREVFHQRPPASTYRRGRQLGRQQRIVVSFTAARSIDLRQPGRRPDVALCVSAGSLTQALLVGALEDR
jgi:hypothetical protein